MNIEQLLRDIDDIDTTLDKLREWMSFRYDDKFSQRGTFKNRAQDIIVSTLLNNVMEFVDAVDRIDEEEMSIRAADCINLICMLFILEPEPTGI